MSSSTIPLKALSHEEHDSDDDVASDGHVDGTADDAQKTLLAADPLNHGNDIDSEFLHQLGITSTDTNYERQAKVINKAISDIGLGKYQWQLFTLCGLGWFADNLWMQGLALTLPQLSTEFGVSASTVRYTTMFTFIGLSLGSTFWGIASDYIGRRPAFNATLLLCGVFGTAVAFGPNWPLTTFLYACMGLGVGGNLPVDGALFLEFLPSASSKLLTLLSIWWPIGQLFAAIIGWAVIPPYSCDEGLQPCSLTNNVTPCCASSDNRGWRYLNFIMGVLTLFMFFCRFCLFKLYESPKFYLSRNQPDEAVEVVQSLARYNGTKTWLTESTLEKFVVDEDQMQNSRSALVRNQRFDKFSMAKVAALFQTRQMAITTVLLWLSWWAIGLAFPLFNAFLPQYLKHAGQEGTGGSVSIETAYRGYLITSVAGVPGSIIAYYTVDHAKIGRKGTMAISTLISGLFLFFFTLSDNSTYQVICSSIEAFFQNIMYGVLYAFTPEVFPAPVRGTGTGIASLLNRITGLAAPVVAAKVGAAHPVAPIILAGVMYMVAGLSMFLIPIETRDIQSL